LLAKVGLELHLLSDLFPFVAVLTTDTGMAPLRHISARHDRRSAVFKDGTSIGRALRLRIESLLI
jgi:hypothetical protein